MDINGVDTYNDYGNLDTKTAMTSAQYANDTAKIESFENTLLNSEDDAELKEACDEFEAYFLELMIKQMEKTTLKDDDENSMFKEGQAEKMTKSFLYQGYAELMTDAGGIGLSDQMYEQIQMQRQNVVDVDDVLAGENGEETTEDNTQETSVEETN